jgi:zinc transport system ATP-binding protein
MLNSISQQCVKLPMRLQRITDMKEKAPVISVQQLQFAYQTTQVLNQVNFSVNPGEFIGVIGPNGGGKTTLLKLIMGFLKPKEGTIRVFDEPAYSVAAHRRLAYVPQSVRFDREFPISVQEVVLSGLLTHLPWYGFFNSSQRQAALEALDRVRLADYAQCSFGILSGGQAQRVLIARALVSKPELLLLDEPTASVDNQSEAEIYAILKELHAQHMTILMVTHDLKAALHHVERVLYVQGQVWSLKPEDVCDHFSIGLFHPPLIRPGASRSSLIPK